MTVELSTTIDTDTTEHVTIVLPEPLAEAVRAAVEAGEYASTSDVLSDALRLWEMGRDERLPDPKVLQRHWDSGKASGLSGEVDIGALIAEEKAQKARAT
jgi:antitoxin ParD1/3/4